MLGRKNKVWKEARKCCRWAGEEVALLTRMVWEACQETESTAKHSHDHLGVGEPGRQGSSMSKTADGIMRYKRQSRCVEPCRPP